MGRSLITQILSRRANYGRFINYRLRHERYSSDIQDSVYETKAFCTVPLRIDRSNVQLLYISKKETSFTLITGMTKITAGDLIFDKLKFVFEEIEKLA